MSDPSPDDEDRQLRPFADVLLDLAGGTVHAEMSAELRELTEDVQATGKKGSLTLDVKISTVGNNHDALQLQATVRSKLPQSDPQSSIFFTDSDGNLVRENPSQPRLPLTAVAPAGVDPDTGEMKEAR